MVSGIFSIKTEGFILTLKFIKPKDMQALFSRVKNEASQNKISWEGDIHSGHCTGRGFEGTYAADADYITISVLKKPPFVSKSRIEGAIKEYLSLGD
jgi:hypothetical protein